MKKRPMENEASFRHIVRERDNWTCQKCGCAEHLQAHHIEPHNGNNNNPDNGMTLCVYCHAKQHPEMPFSLFISNAIKAEKEGCVSASKLAKELEVHPRTIVRRARRLGFIKPMQKWVFNQSEAHALRNWTKIYPGYILRIKSIKKSSLMFIMTTEELCREIEIHQSTLYRWMKRYRDFPAFRAGGQGNFRFDIAQVQQWINKHQFDAYLVEKEDADE